MHPETKHSSAEDEPRNNTGPIHNRQNGETGTDRTVRTAKGCQAARTSLRSTTRWVKSARASQDDNDRKNFQILLKSFCNARDNHSMEVRSDPIESAKSHFFDAENLFRQTGPALSAPAPYVHGTVARQVDGIFIAQLNCPRTSTVLPLKT